MENLKFRRQFLLTPVEWDKIENWQFEKLDDYFLYVHPDCHLEKSLSVNQLYLIGYFFDPHSPQKKSKEILNDLSQEDIENFPKRLYSLVGRFVLIIKQNNDFIFYNDACGLKTFYYTKSNDKIYAGSQPLLIGQVLKIKKTTAYDEYFNSDYVSRNIEHWLPSGLTLYQNIYHLVPNHSLKYPEYVQSRYYPNQHLKKGRYLDLVSQFSTLLKQIVSSANNNMDLAFSLTAGWDSRILLSSCKDIIKNIEFYTLMYRNMNDKNMDIKVPKSLSKSLAFKYNVLDCQQEISPEFAEIYKQNTDMAHINDWGKIAYGMSRTYPQKRVAVKGNCSEIGRCFYYPEGKHKNHLTENDFLQLENGWNKLSFIKNQIENWFNEIRLKENNFGYDLFDLFYWEHRMGSWQAQSQLEWDIVQEVFSPFNSRELLDIILAIDTSKRKANNPILYKDAMNILWSEVLSEPINPRSAKKKRPQLIISILRITGLLPILKEVLRKYR